MLFGCQRAYAYRNRVADSGGEVKERIHAGLARELVPACFASHISQRNGAQHIMPSLRSFFIRRLDCRRPVYLVSQLLIIPNG